MAPYLVAGYGAGVFSDPQRAQIEGLRIRRLAIAARRAQVAILRFGWPGLSAEEVARRLKCSPGTIRGDWRWLREAQGQGEEAKG